MKGFEFIDDTKFCGMVRVQLGDIRGREKANANNRRRARKKIITLQFTNASNEPIHRRFRKRERNVLSVHKIRIQNPKWTTRSTSTNKLLQKPPFQEPPIRPIHQLHKPKRSHPLFRLIPKHVRPAPVRPPPPHWRPPCWSCLRLRLHPSHPVPRKALHIALPRHSNRDSELGDYGSGDSGIGEEDSEGRWEIGGFCGRGMWEEMLGRDYK